MNNNILSYFDWDYYREKYPDIKQNCQTYEDCIWHFCGVRNLNSINKILNGDGMKEGRLFNKKLEELERYGYDKYIQDNPILKNKKNIEIELHFLDNYEKCKLKEENDNITKYFDIEYYKNNNSDLKNLSELELKTHFINHGKNEGRLFSEKLKEFDKKSYIEEHQELNNKSMYELYIHFLDNYEKYKLKFQKEIYNITKYFDIEYYKNNNSDLKNLSELELKTHFINDGKNEGRLFNEKLKEFDKKSYIEEHQELNNKSIYELYIHFLDNYKEFIYVKKGDITYLKDLSNLENTIVIIHNYNMHKGGSLKFIKDVCNNFKEYDYIFVWSKNILDRINFSKNKIMILQYFLFTDIDVNILKNIIIYYNIKLIIPLHDFYFCNKEMYKLNNLEYYVHNNYLNSNIIINSQILCLFYIAYKILYPSEFVYSIYRKIYKNSNLIKFNWIDYKLDKNIKYRRQKIVNNIINIGMLSENSIYKGTEYIDKLEKISKYKEYTINIFIVDKNLPKYNEEEYFTFIKKYNINGLLYLNKWGETYCYSLTKALLTGIPIFYNNIGCFKERIPIAEHYIKNNESEENLIDEEKLLKNYYKFLDIIIENKYDTYDTYDTNSINKIINKENYKGLLEYNLNYKLEQSVNKKDINRNYKVFPIYFPQFHKLDENDYNFYENYTDITNLYYLNLSNNKSKNLNDYPSLDYFNLSKVTDYDYNNQKIINKQFELLNEYKLNGFAVYYYWFSKNSITNENKIMYSVIKKLLNNNYNSNIFYIWANQDWSNEKSLSHKKCNIENDYSNNNINKMIDELIEDFKHKNYFKIDNKPVFYILHPWEISKECLLFIKNQFNVRCKQNGFNGINLRLNNMNEDMNKISNKNDYFYIHPNYKKNQCTTYDEKEKCSLLNYEKYVKENIKLDCDVQCLFYDFDNEVRLSKPNRLEYRTKVINNSINNKLEYINKINEFYKNKLPNDNNILLINAWNEWGEKMTLETSQKNKNKYLELI
uniref:Uncharacterized protein n=1 Tax=viral metagenome TaxID=1070528 RepID=A0A6C0LCP6_9ZZZZ